MGVVRDLHFESHLSQNLELRGGSSGDIIGGELQDSALGYSLGS